MSAQEKYPEPDSNINTRWEFTPTETERISHKSLHQKRKPGDWLGGRIPEGISLSEIPGIAEDVLAGDLEVEEIENREAFYRQYPELRPEPKKKTRG